MSNTGKHTTESGSISPYWLVLALAVAGVLFYAGYSASVATRVNKVSFNGLHFSEVDELRALLPELAGEKVDSLNYLMLLKQLEKAPYVKEASAVIGYKGILEFQVEERTPIGMLTGGEQRYYVDSSGVVLPVILSKAVRVPLVYGLQPVAPGDTLESDGFKMANEFLKSMKGDHLLSATISEITVDEDEGISAFTHEGSVPLQFGKSQFNRKLNIWRTFYTDVVVSQGLQQFTNIDFRFDGQIVTRQHPANTM